MNMKTSDRTSSPGISERSARNDTRSIEPFQPPPNAVYTIEITSHLADVPRRTILHYCKHGLISSAVDPTNRGYYFDRRAIRDLRRIEGLRSVCGDDMAGIKIILDLMNEVERLQFKVRSLVQ
jgi:MerR-like DNA binding protein